MNDRLIIRSDFYRPDIDGLRAFAVVPVILFHAQLTCPGGFIGVDVFFVISGYLITSIIERHLKLNRFSVIEFYHRRIRRIFPAMFVMIFVSFIAAFLFLTPVELKDFGRSLIAVSAFSANILFYRRSGYFDQSSEFNPLLHMWTLSVEEQFYILWPLLLSAFSAAAVSKWKIPGILCIILGSLLLSEYWVNNNPNAAFYLLPSRAWELALGAALAVLPSLNILSRAPHIAAEAASLVGLFMLGAAITVYDAVTPFPGYAALLPCTGAALIIAAGERRSSVGGRMLSLRPLIWTGRISYSLYLWHWPILVFGRLILNHELDFPERISLVLLTFFVAWLSWRFVESPFRDAQQVRCKSRTWVTGGLATAVLFVSIGTLLVLRDGFPTRSPDIVRWIAEMEKEAQAFQHSPCLARGGQLPNTEGCLLGALSPASSYSVVLWGDSHAAHFAPALKEIGQRQGFTAREITKAGCPPVPGVSFLPTNGMNAECPTFNDTALKTVVADKQVRVVVLASNWDTLVEGHARVTLDNSRPSLPDSRQLFILSLRKTLDALVDSGHQVILVGQVPLPKVNPISCIARARFNKQEESSCATVSVRGRAETETRVAQALQTIVQGNPKIRIVFPYKRLCDNQKCAIVVNDRVLYMDDAHLSSDGARIASTDLETSIAAAIAMAEAIPSRGK
jgi:peptidoglycan/LPS O-acetylase OafA/YrhL